MIHDSGHYLYQTSVSETFNIKLFENGTDLKDSNITVHRTAKSNYKRLIFRGGATSRFAGSGMSRVKTYIIIKIYKIFIAIIYVILAISYSHGIVQFVVAFFFLLMVAIGLCPNICSCSFLVIDVFCLISKFREESVL